MVQNYAFKDGDVVIVEETNDKEINGSIWTFSSFLSDTKSYVFPNDKTLGTLVSKRLINDVMRHPGKRFTVSTNILRKLNSSNEDYLGLLKQE